MTERGEVAAVLVEGDEGNWRWGREKSWLEREADGSAERKVKGLPVGLVSCVSERRPWFGKETHAAGEEERELGAKQRTKVEERSGKRKGDQRLGKVVGRLQLKRE
ncbi:hypothetical protein Peur_053584 [Populus x canadensis]